MACSQVLCSPGNQPKPKKPPEPIVEPSLGAERTQGHQGRKPRPRGTVDCPGVHHCMPVDSRSLLQPARASSWLERTQTGAIDHAQVPWKPGLARTGSMSMLEHLGRHSRGRSGLQNFESTVILSLGILHRNKTSQLRLKSHPIEKDFRKTQFQLQSKFNSEQCRSHPGDCNTR